MIERIFDLVTETDKKAHVKTVFGEPQTVGDRTLIPVAEVRYAYGVGHGKGRMPASKLPEEASDAGSATDSGKMEGEGGGARLVARPIAVIEITSSGMQVVPICDSTRLTLAGMALGAWALCLITWTIRRLAR